MRDELENTKSTQKNSIYKKTGLGIYIIFAVIYYFFMQDIFLDGTFFLIVGIALLLIIIFKFFKAWIQHRSATHPKLDFTSSGVLNPSTFLGRLFKLSSID